MKKLIVINLLSCPGTGKSTLAGRLFVALKEYHLNVEQVREYPKDLVWEDRFNALTNQIQIFSNQHNLIWVLKDKVDIVVVEGSLLNSLAYIDDNPQLKALLISEYNKFHNINLFLLRKVDYQAHGRYQDYEGAVKIDNEIIKILEDNNIEYKTINPKDREEFLFIVEDIRKIHQSMINNQNT